MATLRACTLLLFLILIGAGGSLLAQSSIISDFPYSNGFEEVNNDWIPSQDGIWRKNSGRTSSRNTGPNSAFEGDMYYYTEATNRFNRISTLNGPKFDLTNALTATVTFHYHMYGSSMGLLAFEVYYNKEWRCCMNRA
ncbi:hypothetical protein [Lewinella sp. 4G2]|uniref:hypothetical protein n=1 Tax=Lewinella sp. 4G2 TaxID=1803372 RepID=UPI0018D2DA86|nr:hypothetical protein [Lewinella sp. 4G2]